jgi:hypothetical protein
MSVLLGFPIPIIWSPKRPHFTILSAPTPLREWWFRFTLKPPTRENFQAAITVLQQTTQRHINEALEAGNLPEVAYWQNIQQHQLDSLRFWREPPSRRGRYKGSGAFRDAEEFCTVIGEIMKTMNEYDIEEVAAYMRRKNLKTQSDNLDSIVRMLYRYAKTYHVNLRDLFTFVHRS